MSLACLSFVSVEEDLLGSKYNFFACDVLGGGIALCVPLKWVACKRYLLLLHVVLVLLLEFGFSVLSIVCHV